MTDDLPSAIRRYMLGAGIAFHERAPAELALIAEATILEEQEVRVGQGDLLAEVEDGMASLLKATSTCRLALMLIASCAAEDGEVMLRAARAALARLEVALREAAE
jgi:hypothetical protein